MSKDINKKAYGPSTLAKLDIFEQYLTEWLPVFIHGSSVRSLTICDYFAGAGQDCNKTPGSPLRILRTIEKFRGDIFKKRASIRVVLNERKKQKQKALQGVVAPILQKMNWGERVAVEFTCEAFQDLFKKKYDTLRSQPNLIFVDQYGIKQVTPEIFKMLTELDRTDFLFFFSSSYMKRFAERPEFVKYFPDTNASLLATAKNRDTHRIMVEYYKSKIPLGNSTKLYPFTLKRGANVYGLVFGSKHPLGFEKFLNIVWERNEINGEANFDIDNDSEKRQSRLFEARPLSKRKAFEARLENLIRKAGEISNRAVYEFTLNAGHPPKHAKECVSRLKKECKVSYTGNIGFTHNSCVRKAPKLIRSISNG
ncbi:MAG: three-Cys-motif partner protein TcmP [Planctomycetes bacterium]|nr:three-Cys-motif partner protein TcmP [Planctomycetota bacterium]